MVTDSKKEYLYTLMSVDDEPIVHDMVARILKRSHLPVRVCASAGSGREALQLAETTYPDICLLDIHMEGMDGLELAGRLKDELDHTPCFIYLTAYDRFEYARRALRLGAEEYLLKPIRQEELLGALGRAVDRLQVERLERLEKECMRRSLEEVLPALTVRDEPKMRRTALLVREVRDYVDEHFAEKLSLDLMAEYFHLSSGYLGSLFKFETGMAFRAYLRSVRIARARELMTDQRLNLTEIAFAVGYEDINYFSQAFLDETGVRPSEYRGAGKRWAR
ncbi:MAG: response regulator [bacterium]|jgi:two-component system response regulator YesN|nr:response regulator [bacterium]MDD3805110.1 response regulator [bacterium]MDD4152878.1 response regulator [bacterium]